MNKSNAWRRQTNSPFPSRLKFVAWPNIGGVMGFGRSCRRKRAPGRWGRPPTGLARPPDSKGKTGLVPPPVAHRFARLYDCVPVWGVSGYGVDVAIVVGLGRREEAKAERRRRIIAAARDLIRQTGDTNLSMRM